jgi:Domain of unknown function (DUF6265)
MRGSVICMLGLALLATAAASARAQEPEAIERVGFMVGCWRGNFLSRTIEERYTPAWGGLILGTTRYLQGDRATNFEFSHIAAEGSTVVLTPYPGGERSEHPFRLSSGESGNAVFEAPEHDFPKRVLYEAAPGDSLIARVDGGEGSDDWMEWRMGRIDCDDQRARP